MEDIAADDDLLSDMLLDSLEFEPKIATHKMNQSYRSPRYKTQDVIDIVRDKVVVDVDVNGALEALLKLDVIKKHIVGKTTRQTQEFQLHARRYLETYLPESGVEFALTTRYKRASEQISNEAQTSKAGQAEAQARADAEKVLRESQKAQYAATKGKTRMSGETGVALGTSKADLCVVATKPFHTGDLVILCKGGVKDLTKSEDEALREEAAIGRERQKDEEYSGVLGQGRDFSVIRSARKGCSQLLLGPARFVNHDCEPNCEFHRLGPSQMVFKCLRNIGLNEEITTYYGDNYFEVGNAECLCRTCEVRGKGAFSLPESMSLEEDTTSTLTSASSQQEREFEQQRRTSQRKIPNRSPPPQPTSPIPTTTIIEKNGKKIEKTFLHCISQREFDEKGTSHRGPKCTCLTCGSSFWAPETWWVPDECRRCERHYRIFKADWPGRLPTETGWDVKAKKKRKEMEGQEVEMKRRKLLQAPSPSVSSNSDTDTPVKLSPLRQMEPDKPVSSTMTKTSIKTIPAKAKIRRKKILIMDDGTDEDAIDAALQRTSPADAGKIGRRREDKAENGEEESDLTSVSDQDLEDYYHSKAGQMINSPSAASSEDSSDSKPSGPKMLGKEAKTETLALFWGAPTGDRRKRRQSNNALESLSTTMTTTTTIKTPKSEFSRRSHLPREYRRTPSDNVKGGDGIDTGSSESLEVNREGRDRRQQQQQQQHHQQHQQQIQGRADFVSPPASATSSTTSRITAEGLVLHSPTPSVTLPLSEAQQSTSEAASPISSVSGLATRGPARTSVSNLAMAWSAGVEGGGRGSRRKHARNTSQTSPLIAATMPAKKKVLIKQGEGLGYESEEKMTIVKKEEREKEGQEEDYLEIENDGESAKSHSRPLPYKQSSLQSPIYHSGSPSACLDDPPIRHVSPLAGPSPITTSSRPGALPGLPMRKNLRWGSGKTSSSRPMVGPAAPLVGSTANVFASGGQASEFDVNHQSSRPSSPGGLINEASDVAKLSGPSSPFGVLNGRPYSPLARSALYASALSSQAQARPYSGNGNSHDEGNGGSNGAHPLADQQHTLPSHSMVSPLTTDQPSFSPGVQSTQMLLSPSKMMNGDQQIIAGHQQVDNDKQLCPQDRNSDESLPPVLLPAMQY
ncbi:hypothetical protein CBS101457_000733 [Exobasidium rhododendri]|nr:hypothetical protein CBS101457_000733 [Exobasidium rhododendri]